MKKNLFRTLAVSTMLAATTFFVGCDEDLGLEIGVDQTIESIYTIQPSSDTVISRTDTIYFNLDSILTANDADRSNLKSIELKSMTLTITDAAGTIISTENFNNFKSLTASALTFSGMSGIVAHYDETNIGNNRNPVSFVPFSVPFNFLESISQKNLILKLDGAIKTPITAPMHIKSTTVVKVNAKL